MSLYSPEEIELHIAVMGFPPPEAALPLGRATKAQQLRAQLDEICRNEGPYVPTRARPPEAVCRGYRPEANAEGAAQPPKPLWREHTAPGDEQMACAGWLQKSLAHLPAFSLLPERVGRLRQGWPRAIWRAAAGRLLQQLPAGVPKPDRYLFWAAMGLQEGHWLDQRSDPSYAPADGWPEPLQLFALRRRAS